MTSDSDTVYWKNSLNERIKVFDLPEIDTISEFVFRKWSPSSMLEVSKRSDIIDARLIFNVFEVWGNDYRADIFTKSYVLPNIVAKQLYDLVSNSDIQKIPSDKYIEGWQQGFDGITYIFEIVADGEYSFKNYWTPSAQKNIRQALDILVFNKKIGEIVDYRKYADEFIESIPFIYYTYYGVAYAVTKPPTKKELRKYRREREKRIEKNKR